MFPVLRAARTRTFAQARRTYATGGLPPGGGPPTGGIPPGGAVPPTGGKPPGLGKKPDNTPVYVIGGAAVAGLAYYMFAGKSESAKAENKAHQAVSAVGNKAEELEKKAKDALGK